MKENQLTLQQYRNIDLTILAAVMAVSQLLIVKASTAWFSDQLYVVSPVAAVTALVMMRWGLWAGVHAFLGGILFTAFSGGTWQHYLIYGFGSLLSLAAFPLLKAMGKEKIRKDLILSLVFAFAVQLLMQLGRAGLAKLLGHTWTEALGFITTDILSVLFTMVIIGIVRRIDGLFEDQKTYLLRIQKERNQEGREQF